MINQMQNSVSSVLARRVGFVLLCFLLSTPNYSQKYDYNWMFPTAHRDSNVIVSFIKDADRFNLLYDPLSTRTSGTNASMSNKDGDFIFGSNGCIITQSDFLLMENGDDINPGIPHNEQCRSGYKAGHQSCLPIPFPESDSLYYLFHQSQVYKIDSFRTIFPDALRYSIIDMSSNGGLGSVLEKNIPLLADTSARGGAMTAVKHHNNRDWWFINPSRDTSSYFIFLIDPNGIRLQQEQIIGLKARTQGEGGGGHLFTPNGKKYISWDVRDGVYIFDFDRESGKLSNFQWIDHRIDSVITGGAAISPNSRFLYTTTLLDIYQYDLEANDILASRIHIDTYDGHASPGGCVFWSGQLGPDCKVYFNSTPSCTELHVIHYPDLKGKDCDFRQHDFSLKYSQRGSLPHFPNYRLDTAPVCDTNLTVSVIKVPIHYPEYVSIYPNPNDGGFTIDSSFPYDEVVIRDIQGRIVLKSHEDNVEMYGQESGLYLVQLIRDGRMVGSGRFVLGD